MKDDEKNILLFLIIVIVGGGLFYAYSKDPNFFQNFVGATLIPERELNLPLTVSASAIIPITKGNSGRYGSDSAIYYKDFYGAEKIEVESYLSAGGVRQGRTTCENWGAASANIDCNAKIGDLSISCGGVSSSVSVSDWGMGMSSPQANGNFITTYVFSEDKRYVNVNYNVVSGTNCLSFYNGGCTQNVGNFITTYNNKDYNIVGKQTFKIGISSGACGGSTSGTIKNIKATYPPKETYKDYRLFDDFSTPLILDDSKCSGGQCNLEKYNIISTEAGVKGEITGGKFLFYPTTENIIEIKKNFKNLNARVEYSYDGSGSFTIYINNEAVKVTKGTGIGALDISYDVVEGDFARVYVDGVLITKLNMAGNSEIKIKFKVNQLTFSLEYISFGYLYGCIRPAQYMLGVESFIGEKDISVASTRYEVKDFCYAHPSIITSGGGSTTSYELIKKLGRGEIYHIPAGQTVTLFYIFYNDGSIKMVCGEDAFDIKNNRCTNVSGITYFCSEGTFDPSIGTCVAQPEVKFVCLEGRYDVAQNVCIFSPPIQTVCPLIEVPD